MISSEVRVPLLGSQLVLARAAWLLVVLLTLTTFLYAVSAHYEQLLQLEGPVVSESYGGAETLRAGLAASALSVSTYALFQIAVGIVYVAISVLIALFIFVRRSSEPIALLVSLALVQFAYLMSISHEALDQPGTISQGLDRFINYIGVEVFTLTFYLFPDGRFVPRWTKWLMLLWVLLGIIVILLPTSEIPNWLGVFAFLGPVITTVGTQIYRYARVSNTVEQQQTKWVVSGFAVGMIGFVVIIFLSEIFPAVQFPGSPSELVGTVVVYALLTLIPFAFAIAILRSRLWDIDILIRRTVTYALVTALLLLVYFGSVVFLQQLFSSVTGSAQNEIVTVVSTLAIAALFVPLRTRIQGWIDKRFNRNKYDAQQVLNDFARTVRDETDLEKLTGRLMQVVHETMQPKSVSVWLKK
jgi:hypothetical protein